MKRLLLSAGMYFAFISLNAQSVGISATAITPDPSSLLEIRSTNRGILIPRVALTGLLDAATVPAPATSLLVYNTATAGVSPNNVTPGYYYWGGAQWVRLLSGSMSNDWSLTGNAGTSPATNFIGTTDAVDWAVRTNNIENVRVTSGGYVGIGTWSPTHKLTVQSPTISTLRLIGPGGFGSTARLNFGDGNYVYLEEDADDYLHIFGQNRIGLMGGNVGVGTLNPVTKFQVLGKATISRDGSAECCGNDATLALADNPASTGRASISFHNSGEAEGTFGLIQNTINGVNSRRFRMYDNQGIYMGLELTGKLWYGNAYTRTETRDDAGLQGNVGAQSGFYETSNPVNFPAGASSWWHMIDTRHSNNGNNFALQIAGSFFDQRLWFRKTNNNPAQPWTEILTSATSFASFGQGFSQASATPNSVIMGDNSSTYSAACWAGYSTGNWFNIPGMSITRTITAGNIVAVNVHIRWKTDDRCYYAPETMWFRILRDGVEIARSSIYSADGTHFILEGDGNIFYYDAGATAGAHTYSTQVAMANSYSTGTESLIIMDGYITLIELKQ
jgi:hypothetical protein